MMVIQFELLASLFLSQMKDHSAVIAHSLHYLWPKVLPFPKICTSAQYDHLFGGSRSFVPGHFTL